ncbi:hypothetical protein [Thermococcus sp. MAR1]|uniref:hypothetical protein n=1 Tax=Thermococcus sp. MAR1 TaxID=1638263 RepID=UPI00143B3504|nr:hypothetical protein [Thermococcus sp. MAR1]NJE10336.1 hypothetical protein [Thermococcus sp. MAR1]
MPPREDPGENEPGGDAGATARPQRGPRGRAFRVTEHDGRGKPRPSTDGPPGLTRPSSPLGTDGGGGYGRAIDAHRNIFDDALWCVEKVY